MARCIFSEFCRKYCTARSSYHSRIGNSFRYWWRHVTLSHRKPLIVILIGWFPCELRCSVRSSGRLLIGHGIVSLVPLLHFHGTWIYSCVSWRLSSLLWPHGLLIELQVDGVSRECEVFIIVVSLRRRSSSGDNLSDFTTQCDIDTAMVTKLEEGSATLCKRFIRAKHRNNILISKRKKLYCLTNLAS